MKFVPKGLLLVFSDPANYARALYANGVFAPLLFIDYNTQPEGLADMRPEPGKVIAKSGLNMRYDADATATLIATYPSNTPCFILGKKDEWFFVAMFSEPEKGNPWIEHFTGHFFKTGWVSGKWIGKR